MEPSPAPVLDSESEWLPAIDQASLVSTVWDASVTKYEEDRAKDHPDWPPCATLGHARGLTMTLSQVHDLDDPDDRKQLRLRYAIVLDEPTSSLGGIVEYDYRRLQCAVTVETAGYEQYAQLLTCFFGELTTRLIIDHHLDLPYWGCLPKQPSAPAA